MRRSAISCHQMSILPLQTKNDLTDLARYCKQRWPSQLVGKDRIFLLSPIQLSIEWFCKQIHIQSYIYNYWFCQKKQTTMLIHHNFTMFSSNFSQSTPQAYPILSHFLRLPTPWCPECSAPPAAVERAARTTPRCAMELAGAMPLPFPSPWHGEIGGFTWVWIKIRYPNNWMVNTKLD